MSDENQRVYGMEAIVRQIAGESVKRTSLSVVTALVAVFCVGNHQDVGVDRSRGGRVELTEAARFVYELYTKESLSTNIQERCEWSLRWARAQAAEAEGTAPGAFEAHAARMKDIYAMLIELEKINRATRIDVAAARFYALEAETLR